MRSWKAELFYWIYGAQENFLMKLILEFWFVKKFSKMSGKISLKMAHILQHYNNVTSIFCALGFSSWVEKSFCYIFWR